MELTKLIFSADTKELLDAKRTLDSLGESLKNLANSESKVTKAASDGAESLNKQTAALSSRKKATDDATKQQEKWLSLLEKEERRHEAIIAGYSRGEATKIAQAKSYGMAGKELEKYTKLLEAQRKFLGDDPFDKSRAGLDSLSKKYTEIKEAIRQYNAESGLTREQTRDLARDKERLIEKLKTEKASFSEIKKAIREHNAAYVEAANRVNALTAAEKEKERTSRDIANAARNVQAAEERLFATVSHLNGGLSQNATLNERAALALGSYERNLRLAGITGEEAARRLQKFKAAQEQVSAADAQRRASYAARGIGVQMGDVAVSLASGQNPLIVAIQQGDQIRGLLQQSGLEGAALANVMKTALSSIITSFKDVGLAMGTFMLGGLDALGKKAMDVGASLTGLNSIIRVTNSLIDEANAKGLVPNGAVVQINAFTKSLLKNKLVMRGLGLAAGTLLTTFGAVALAIYQGTKANDALLVKLTTTGAAFDMSTKQLIAFAEANNKYSTSANELKEFIGELGAAGFSTDEALSAVAESAQRFSHVSGIALEEIAKSYGEISKAPTKGLAEIAKKIGYVDKAILQQVKNLEDQGKAYEATKLAIDAYNESLDMQSRKIEEGLSPMGKLFLSLKQYASEAWDEVVDIANSDFVVNTLKLISAAIVTLVAGMKQLISIAGSAGRAMRLIFNPFEDFDLDKEWGAFKSRYGAISSELKKDLDNIIVGTGTSSTPKVDIRGNKKYATELLKSLQSGVKGSNFDILGNVLDNSLKAIKNFAKQEQDIHKDRLRFIELYNEQGLMSIDAYYKAQTTAAEDSFVIQNKLLQDQIDLVNAYKAKDSSPKAQFAAQEKLNELISEQNRLEQDSFATIAQLGIEREKAFKSYQNSINDINKQYQVLIGNLSEAAKIESESQFEEIRRVAILEGNDALQSQINLLQRVQNGQGVINELQQRINDQMQRYQLITQNTNSERQKGTITTKEAEERLSQAQEATLGNMKRLIKEYEKLAALDPTGLTDDQIAALERLGIQFEMIKAQIESFGAEASKVNTKLFDSLESDLSGWLTNFEGGLKGLANSFSRTLQRMVAEKAASKLFDLIDPTEGASGAGRIIGGAITALGGILGLGKSSGGYTGDGNAYQPAGFYHPKEFIFNAADTKRIGLQNLQALSAGNAQISNSSSSDNSKNFDIKVNINVPQGGQTDRRTLAQIAAAANKGLSTAVRNS